MGVNSILHAGLIAVLAFVASSAHAASKSTLVALADPHDPVVTRGPYLQRGTPSGMVVRWETHIPSFGRVCYGKHPGVLTHFVDGSEAVDHLIEIDSLDPGTKYRYSIGTSDTACGQGRPDRFFRTSPEPGTVQPVRIWVIGDSGAANQVARDVRDDYLDHAAGSETDVWLMLGDNAYPTGTLMQYQAAVFDTYPDVLQNTVLWPAFGNHDAISASSALQTGPYFDLFTLPRAGESGGMPSGTEAYYSFDHANIHFMALDSQGSSLSPTGPMLTWAAADLASTTQDWVIAYWHHPVYSKGSHNSDSIFDSGGRMVRMRQNALPILEAGGVDLVLAGHSHVYERSQLIDGHYGFSRSFDRTHVVDDGDGCICAGSCPECPGGGDGAYVKASVGANPHEGTVYATVGSSSRATGSLPLNHPVMVLSLREAGSMVVEVDGLRLDASWIMRGGNIVDSFTLLKGGDSDGDLIPDPEDDCPDTPVGNAVGREGCTADELVDLRCSSTYPLHPGHFVRCVALTTRDAVDQGLLPRSGSGSFLLRHVLPALNRGFPSRGHGLR